MRKGAQKVEQTEGRGRSDGTALELRGRVVAAWACDHAIRLDVDGGYQLRVETACTLRTRHGARHLAPGPSQAPSGHLAGRTVSGTRVAADGTLTVTFADGDELRVPSDPDYESWTVTGPRGLRVVCLPGGELACWGATAT